MRDVNYSLRKAYFSALSGVEVNAVAVPVFYQELPANYNASNYIIINSVNNTDSSTKHKSDVISSVSVTIYTSALASNAGKIADDMASQVMSIIYPDGQTRLILDYADGLQLISTRLSGDNTMNYGIRNERKFIDRTLIFKHHIFIG